MNSKEMVYSFQQLLLTVSPAFLDKERLETHEILDYINRTIDRYIKLKYFKGESFKLNVNVLSSSLDDIKDLIEITTTGVPTSFTAITGMNGAYKSDLPADFMGYIRSDSKITRTNVLPCAGQWVPNKEVDYNDIYSFLTTPFNKPILEKPLIVFKATEKGIGDSMITIIDTHTTIDDNMITYIKIPTPIDLNGNNCQLAPYLHEEIVNLAVSMYLDEYKMKLNQSKKQ